jgi:hypothetical protein
MAATSPRPGPVPTRPVIILRRSPSRPRSSSMRTPPYRGPGHPCSRPRSQWLVHHAGRDHLERQRRDLGTRRLLVADLQRPRQRQRRSERRVYRQSRKHGSGHAPAPVRRDGSGRDRQPDALARFQRLVRPSGRGGLGRQRSGLRGSRAAPTLPPTAVPTAQASPSPAHARTRPEIPAPAPST